MAKDEKSDEKERGN